ncbi:dTDP-4-dehydrorhamnose reductase [Mucilaginibacter boryungensis]|uniref:dTDP-4-dehydrorhamnose reductase n=1 Tax=Mucilaginibacter boryungensis TaxID=768480 RepID=A0ABR9XKV9_9SPHI|nr:dTDP-4-dehydrorhamnose reductase [Mucilaginibacter boryungensis]MBE9667880.1 dTDP-4-dehydrorhamnose reductase [Mucilaginibacter boryungensis]
MNNILVFGASGQLGHCLKRVTENSGISNIVFPDESSANILNQQAINILFDEYKPAYCINCAAYTAVDKAEDNIDLARKINKDGAANLAKACKQYNTILIHISTDFVFEGNVPRLLNEEDPAKPLSVYGLTKLEGEQDIITFADKYYILRTSWLYSEFGNNFVKTMLRLGKEKDQLRIIADQIGTPTYGIDLAKAILQIIESGKTDYGIYHYSNEGVASWFDFTKAIFDLTDIITEVLPITTDQYPTPARRPAYSVMDKSKIKSTFDMSIPYWRDSLKDCIAALI